MGVTMDNLTKLHVLVVEDNPDLIRHLSIILDQQGIACIQAKNEQEALKSMSDDLQVIIADINLSEAEGDVRGGIELAERLAQKNVCIPIILISYDPWFFLPPKGSPEFHKLKERLCLYEVLDRNGDSFREDLIQCVINAIKTA